MNVSVTRKYRFSASHRLHTDALTREDNARVFGKCNNSFGHGHDYELNVRVRGRVDAKTGLLIQIEDLDQYVDNRVLHRFANRYINIDVPEFEEACAHDRKHGFRHCATSPKRLGQHFGVNGPKLSGIEIQETARNGFELRIGELRPKVPRTSIAGNADASAPEKPRRK